LKGVVPLEAEVWEEVEVSPLVVAIAVHKESVWMEVVRK
jgi:hypothetical protein